MASDRSSRLVKPRELAAAAFAQYLAEHPVAERDHERLTIGEAQHEPNSREFELYLAGDNPSDALVLVSLVVAMSADGPRLERVTFANAE